MSSGRRPVTTRSADLTAVAVVSNLRHAVVGCEDERGLLVGIELGEESFGLLDDLVDDLYVGHIFLLRAMSHIYKIMTANRTLE